MHLRKLLPDMKQRTLIHCIKKLQAKKPDHLLVEQKDKLWYFFTPKINFSVERGRNNSWNRCRVAPEATEHQDDNECFTDLKKERKKKKLHVKREEMKACRRCVGGGVEVRCLHLGWSNREGSVPTLVTTFERAPR